MIKNSPKQTGSVHIVVIVALIVVVLGALGFVWWNNFHTKPVAKSSQSQASNSGTSTTQQPNTNAPSTLTLVDWKVKFTLASSLKDTEVKYFKRTSNDNPPRTYYAFTTSRIQDLGGKCTGQPFGDTVILTRESDKPIITPDSELINQTPVDGYYYTLSSPIASCSGFDEKGQMREPSKIETNDRATLNISIKSLVAVSAE